MGIDGVEGSWANTANAPNGAPGVRVQHAAPSPGPNCALLWRIRPRARKSRGRGPPGLKMRNRNRFLPRRHRGANFAAFVQKHVEDAPHFLRGHHHAKWPLSRAEAFC